MTPELLFDGGLALLVLGLAVWTICARDTVAAVVGFVVYGLLLALAWVRLHAVDVALTEAAIGSGLTGVLLLGAASRLRATEAASAMERPGAGLRAVAALVSVAVAAGLALVVYYLPDASPTLAPLAAASLPDTGLGNPVTAVLLAYRAMDTLLEKIVLLLALVGIWSLAPDGCWGGRPGLATASAAGPLAFIARLLPPVGIVVGVYVLWVGADYPGGAFQGGTILAAMWLLMMLAGLIDAPRIDRTALRVYVLAGPAVFLAIGLAGIWAAGAFLAYPVPYAKTLIIIIEVALTLSIAATLGLLMAGVPARGADR